MLQPAIIRRLQKEKRGQGYGKDYKPFLTVRDVPSKGRVHRRPALTHGRIFHLLSDLELSAFLLFDWFPSVIDIREQFPLDPEKTLSIASRLGIKHPAVIGHMKTDGWLGCNHLLGKAGDAINSTAVRSWPELAEDPQEAAASFALYSVAVTKAAVSAISAEVCNNIS